MEPPCAHVARPRAAAALAAGFVKFPASLMSESCMQMAPAHQQVYAQVSTKAY